MLTISHLLFAALFSIVSALVPGEQMPLMEHHAEDKRIVIIGMPVTLKSKVAVC